uniref:Uncharacterized protein n=1 Tax=Ditylenchus dipsaci TaxID=166011 RepID=A0A915CRN8_9BILA
MLISVAGCRLRLAPATFFSAVGYGRKVPPESMESPLLQPAYSSSLLGKRRFIYMAASVGSVVAGQGYNHRARKYGDNYAALPPPTEVGLGFGGLQEAAFLCGPRLATHAYCYC